MHMFPGRYELLLSCSSRFSILSSELCWRFLICRANEEEEEEVGAAPVEMIGTPTTAEQAGRRGTPTAEVAGEAASRSEAPG